MPTPTRLRPTLLALVFLAAVPTGLGACAKSESVPGPAPSVVEVPAPEPVDEASPKKPLPGKIGAPPIPPAQLYADCKTRVEGSDQAGECSSDADCQKAGCSQELCISKAEAAEGMMSTCEIRPCFAVLETCGCTEGVCSWAVGD